MGFGLLSSKSLLFFTLLNGSMCCFGFRYFFRLSLLIRATFALIVDVCLTLVLFLTVRVNLSPIRVFYVFLGFIFTDF